MEPTNEDEEVDAVQATSKALDKVEKRSSASRIKQLDRNPIQGYQNYVSTVQIPTFNDQFDSFLPWVSKMKTYLRMFQMRREQQVDAIVSGLSANTAKYLGKKFHEMTPEQIFDKLGKIFNREEVGILVTLSRLKQQPDENVGQFFIRVNTAMEDIEVSEREKEKGIIEAFVKGLRSDIFKRMKDIKIEKSMDAFDMALEIERKSFDRSTTKTVRFQQEEVSELMTVQKKDGSSEYRAIGGSKSKTNRLCFFCKKPGHTFMDCYKATSEQKDHIRKNIATYIREAREANKQSNHLNLRSVSTDENSQLAPK